VAHGGLSERTSSEVAELIRRLAEEEGTRNALQTQLDQGRTEQRVAEAALESEKAAAAVARNALRSEMQARLDEHLTEIAALTQQLQEKQSDLTQARDAHSRREANLTEALQQLRSESDETKVRLDERFEEIASLTSMLAEREASERKLREELQWLREAASILLNDSRTAKGRLARLMPAAFHFTRQQRLLKRRGLFDGDAYLAANTDVAADGVDPLRHYLKHGLSENRRRR
jgi:chromosome segregation ATPase